MSVPEKRNSFASTVRRARLLQAAADRLGQQALADAMSITPRALRMKLGTDRSITDADLACASAFVVADAAIAMQLANDLREAADPQPFGQVMAGIVQSLEAAE